MRLLLFSVFSISLMGQLLANDAFAKLRNIDAFLGSDPDSAIVLSEELLEWSEKNNESLGIVKANLYLGYLYEQKEDYAKATIYYLEGIRQADKRSYEKIASDKIWLRRNLANIFRKFSANRMATQYNQEAIEIAQKEENTKQVIDITFNQALVYQNDKHFSEAVRLLNQILLLVEDEAYKSRILDQIGLVYLDDRNFSEAKQYFERLLNLTENLKLYEAKALHNLGEVYFEQGDTLKSILKLRESLSIKENLETVEIGSLMNSYRNIGRYLLISDRIDESKDYLLKAEAIANSLDASANSTYQGSLEVYKLLSDLYHSQDDDKQGRHFSEVYHAKVQAFMEMQAILQQQEREYNFDLIARNYFNEVERQERIAYTVFWSRLISCISLTGLFLVVGYHRYQKIMLRKSIEMELVNHRFID